jgi:glycosyltransferase involved in cell wall biosynthesis
VLANRIVSEGVPEARMTVIPNGIDPDKFSEQTTTEYAKKQLGLSGKLVLGFTGFMREWHGLEDVLDLLVGENRKDRYLLLVGDGPAKKSILDRAKYLNVRERVHITGVVEREKVADYVAAFDIALQPDVVDYASPLKLFEYIALGRAIVAPAKSNILEILTNGENSVLFEPGNKKDFVNAIESLCTNNTMREKISTQARRLISEKKYYWDCNAKKVLQLYSAFIADS